MAPVTRSTQQARPDIFRSSSETSSRLPGTGDSDPMEPDERFDEHHLEDQIEDDQEDYPDETRPLYSSTVKNMIAPLQETADRVGRQVEEFARCLDKFNTARASTDQKLWDDACVLLDEYNSITTTRRDRIRSSSPKARSSSRSIKSLDETTAEADRVRWEADLWALAHDKILTGSPTAVDDADAACQQAFVVLNQYSPNADIWSSFLNSDLIAQEYEAQLAWLQLRVTFGHLEQEMQDLIAPLLAKADRGDGVWSSTAIYTKTAIKAQKRVRSWTEPLHPSNPGLRNVHKRATDGLPLVAQLDPDASTREAAVLEPQDDFHEQASWQACWEFLRRGVSQADIEEYWSTRKESWRFGILRANDAFMNRSSDLDKSPWLRIMNIATNEHWYLTCQQLAQMTDDNYEYQTAVYGVLSGSLDPSLTVCKTIDDSLFAIFNTLLISRYREFLSSYQTYLANPQHNFFTPRIADSSLAQKYLAQIKTNEKTKEESRDPFILIETALLSNNIHDLFLQLGIASGQVAHTTGGMKHLMNGDPDAPKNEVAHLAALNPDCVRIVAHLQLLYKSLGYLEEPYQNSLYQIENNIVNFMGWLERDGKLNLMPLYASKLSEKRIPYVLGPILLEVVDLRERDQQVRLMKQNNINVSDTIYGIFSFANTVKLFDFKRGKTPFTASRITQLVKAGGNKFRTPKLLPDFMGDQVEDNDGKGIRSVEWYRYIDADNWGKACYSIGTLYKIFLFQGKLAAAKELAQRASLTEISLAALGINAHFADMMSPSEENGVFGIDGSLSEERTKSLSPSKRRKEKEHPLTKPSTTREVAASQANVWSHLEQLVLAMIALEDWTTLAADIESQRNNPTAIRELKRELRRQLSIVQDAMYPLTDRDFLCQPLDDAEANVLRRIRIHYLPEVFLAYNDVLFFAGHAISRSFLVECMELAQLVATNETLTNAFVEGKRMREFMDAMAWSAQGMVEASQLGRNKAQRSANKGEREREAHLGLWDVKWDGKEDADV